MERYKTFSATIPFQNKRWPVGTGPREHRRLESFSKPPPKWLRRRLVPSPLVSLRRGPVKASAMRIDRI